MENKEILYNQEEKKIYSDEQRKELINRLSKDGKEIDGLSDTELLTLYWDSITEQDITVDATEDPEEALEKAKEIKQQNRDTKVQIKVGDETTEITEEETVEISERAESKAQQRLMGIAYAIRQGDMKLSDVPKKYRDKVKSIVKGKITNVELEKFASTKHEDLPEKVDESTFLDEINNHVSPKITKESLMGTLKNNYLIESQFEKYKGLKDYLSLDEFRLIIKFLDKIRKSGMVNMFEAVPFLYGGEKLLKKEIDYRDFEMEDEEELLEMAQEVRDILIRVAMTVLEENNKEITPESVSYVMRKYSKEFFSFWTTTF